MQCILYTNQLTTRLQYIIGVLFTKDWIITHSKETFIASDGFKINYSDSPVTPNEYWIVPQGLLAASNIQPQIIKCTNWEGLPIFFNNKASGIPFDFLSAAFYLITRYEEYLPFEPDTLGRYNHEDSLAFKQQFLQKPLIQLWMKKLVELYQIPGVKHPAFLFTPSYDIDIAYSYLHHAILRNVAGFFRDLVKGDINALVERLQVLNGMQKDPYDVYEWLNLLHSSLQLKPIYFFLLANKRKGIDKNLLPGSVAMQELIQQHANQYSIGIHPSHQSNGAFSLLQKEIQQLQYASNTAVTIARQHYIQLHFPATYQQLIRAGITQDYSMGYPGVNGFRASYAESFAWFDLTTNNETSLMIHPFCYMDATAIYNERITARQAAIDMQYYFDTIKSVGGNCIFILHNHFLTQQATLKEWRNCYADFLLHNFVE